MFESEKRVLYFTCPTMKKPFSFRLMEFSIQFEILKLG